MSISAIHGQTISGYTPSYNKYNNPNALSAYINPATGVDRISISENARKLAQQQNQTATDINQNENSILGEHYFQSEEIQSTNTCKPSITELGKKNFLSMLLETLFLATLEENDAGSSNTANGENTHTGEEGIQRQQPHDTKSANSLADGEKVSEIKKILTDVTKGKIELSDLPKVMAGNNNGGTDKSPRNEKKNTTTSINNSINKLESYV